MIDPGNPNTAPTKIFILISLNSKSFYQYANALDITSLNG